MASSSNKSSSLASTLISFVGGAAIFKLALGGAAMAGAGITLSWGGALAMGDIAIFGAAESAAGFGMDLASGCDLISVRGLVTMRDFIFA